MLIDIYNILGRQSSGSNNRNTILQEFVQAILRNILWKRVEISHIETHTVIDGFKIEFQSRSNHAEVAHDAGILVCV